MKIIRWLSITLLMGSVAVVLWALMVVADVRQFREQPRMSTALTYLTSERPDYILARYLMFQPGSPGYFKDLRTWTYYDSDIQDKPWNRRLLRNDLERMSDEELSQLLPHYPWPADEGLLGALERGLELGVYRAIPMFRDLPEATVRASLQPWAMEQIRKVPPDDLGGLIRQLAQVPVIEPAKILDSLWDGLSEDQRSDVLYSIASTCGDPLPTKRKPTLSNDLLSWIDRRFGDLDSRQYRQAHQLIGCFLPSEATRAEATAIFLRHLDRVVPRYLGEVLSDLPREVALESGRTLFTRTAGSYPSVATTALHAIAHRDILVAEELAHPVLEGPDSELRKGVVVILSRHESAAGRARLEDAFRGRAPRRVMFPHTADYLYTTAHEEYSRIARHDYLETGKSWPPAYLEPPLPDEVRQWQSFISRYPWFPGTDDAYYRLAHRQYSDGDLVGSWYTIRAALNAELPDRDALPYLILLQHAILRDPQRVELECGPELLRVRQSPPAIVPFIHYFSVDHQREARIAYRRLPLSMECVNLLGATPRQARLMLAIHEIPLTSSPIPRIQEVLSQLEDARDLNCVLYLECVEGASVEKLQRIASRSEVLGYTKSQLAETLDRDIQSARSTGDRYRLSTLMAWVHGHHHLNPWWNRQLFLSASQVEPSELLPDLRENHSQFRTKMGS